MASFTEDYDPGFLNVPGFGQNVTNPLAPVYYESLGVVKDLSVYQSMYAAQTVNAGLAVNVGKSSLSTSGFLASVPAQFAQNVEIQRELRVSVLTDTKRLFVRGREYIPQKIVAENGTFIVLAEI